MEDLKKKTSPQAPKSEIELASPTVASEAQASRKDGHCNAQDNSNVEYGCHGDRRSTTTSDDTSVSDGSSSENNVKDGVEETEGDIEVPLKVSGKKGSVELRNSQFQNNISCRTIRISRKQKSLLFYVSLARRFLRYHQLIELTAMGRATCIVITIAEMIVERGYATKDHVEVSMDSSREVSRGTEKSRIRVWMSRSDLFDQMNSTDPLKGIQNNEGDEIGNLKSSTTHGTGCTSQFFRAEQSKSEYTSTEDDTRLQKSVQKFRTINDYESECEDASTSATLTASEKSADAKISAENYSRWQPAEASESDAREYASKSKSGIISREPFDERLLMEKRACSPTLCTKGFKGADECKKNTNEKENGCKKFRGPNENGGSGGSGARLGDWKFNHDKHICTSEDSRAGQTFRTDVSERTSTCDLTSTTSIHDSRNYDSAFFFIWTKYSKITSVDGVESWDGADRKWMPDSTELALSTRRESRRTNGSHSSSWGRTTGCYASGAVSRACSCATLTRQVERLPLTDIKIPANSCGNTSERTNIEKCGNALLA